ncbi:MAG: hypothetical protein OIF34_10370 [Porticoccaceae bacterium]|nr:hypothetical protein [Porticoccaceae bacterium]
MKSRHGIKAAVFTALAGLTFYCGAGPASFDIDHTRLDPQVIRIYAYGNSNTSIREAMASALAEARRLCRQQGYKHFELIDHQTLYRQDGVRKQPSYTRRGNFEATGVMLDNGSLPITTGNIDIDYNNGSMVSKNRTDHGGGLQVRTNEDPRLASYSNLSRPSERAWAGITVRLLDSPAADQKDVYSAEEVQQ